MKKEFYPHKQTNEEGIKIKTENENNLEKQEISEDLKKRAESYVQKYKNTAYPEKGESEEEVIAEIEKRKNEQEYIANQMIKELNIDEELFAEETEKLANLMRKKWGERNDKYKSMSNVEILSSYSDICDQSGSSQMIAKSQLESEGFKLLNTDAGFKILKLKNLYHRDHWHS
ncbi:hypothetical protein KKG58_00480 [Patescibacteria group bacterium]|nr:hypothetical protein [Patescibacteria group bacterium]